MTILFAASGKGIAIGCIGSRIEETRLLAITGDAIAFEICYVACERSRPKSRSLVPDHPHLDDHPAAGGP